MLGKKLRASSRAPSLNECSQSETTLQSLLLNVGVGLRATHQNRRHIADTQPANVNVGYGATNSECATAAFSRKFTSVSQCLRVLAGGSLLNAEFYWLNCQVSSRSWQSTMSPNRNFSPLH